MSTAIRVEILFKLHIENILNKISQGNVKIMRRLRIRIQPISEFGDVSVLGDLKVSEYGY
jgi:hypothetical protein